MLESNPSAAPVTMQPGRAVTALPASVATAALSQKR